MSPHRRGGGSNRSSDSHHIQSSDRLLKSVHLFELFFPELKSVFPSPPPPQTFPPHSSSFSCFAVYGCDQCAVLVAKTVTLTVERESEYRNHEPACMG